MRRPPRSRGAAFTILEIIIALAILGILAAIGGSNYLNYIEKVRVTRAVSDIRNIQTALETFFIHEERHPVDLTEVGYDTLLDPWGNGYVYADLAVVTKGAARKDKFLVPINSDYDLYSVGKDGQTKAPLAPKVSWDDVIRASNGSFIGLARNF